MLDELTGSAQRKMDGCFVSVLKNNLHFKIMLLA